MSERESTAKECRPQNNTKVLIPLEIEIQGHVFWVFLGTLLCGEIYKSLADTGFVGDNGLCSGTFYNENTFCSKVWGGKATKCVPVTTDITDAPDHGPGALQIRRTL